MKYITTIILVSAILIQGCAHDYTTSGPMAGPATNVQFEAYKEMCIRQPDSELCTEETNNHE